MTVPNLGKMAKCLRAAVEVAEDKRLAEIQEICDHLFKPPKKLKGPEMETMEQESLTISRAIADLCVGAMPESMMWALLSHLANIIIYDMARDNHAAFAEIIVKLSSVLAVKCDPKNEEARARQFLSRLCSDMFRNNLVS